MEGRPPCRPINPTSNAQGLLVAAVHRTATPRVKWRFAVNPSPPGRQMLTSDLFNGRVGSRHRSQKSDRQRMTRKSEQRNRTITGHLFRLARRGPIGEVSQKKALRIFGVVETRVFVIAVSTNPGGERIDPNPSTCVFHPRPAFDNPITPMLRRHVCADAGGQQSSRRPNAFVDDCATAIFAASAGSRTSCIEIFP